MGSTNKRRRKANVTGFGGENRKDTSGLDQAVEDIMAMVNGKGKGRETISCSICWTTGHLAKYVWSKGKGKGKGDYGVDGGCGGEVGYQKDYGKGRENGDEGKGKAGPWTGCWTCRGNHYESDCLVKNRGVHGLEGEHEHDCNDHAPENLGGFNL